MTGTLKFRLPEEQTEFDTACRAGSLAAGLNDIYNEVRRRKKYESHGEETTKILEDLFAFVCNVIHEVGIME